VLPGIVTWFYDGLIDQQLMLLMHHVILSTVTTDAMITELKTISMITTPALVIQQIALPR
jgi:hypothetical protein